MCGGPVRPIAYYMVESLLVRDAKIHVPRRTGERHTQYNARVFAEVTEWLKAIQAHANLIPPPGGEK